MLATLNLQFSPLEITDETLTGSALTPDGAPSADFADLLRLRVDPAPGNGDSPGELLPPGGSQLPLQALPINLETPTGAGAGDELMQADDSMLATEGPDIALNLALQYPVVAEDGPRPATGDAALTTVPMVKAPDLAAAAADSRDILNRHEARPLPPVAQSMPRSPAATEAQQTVAALLDSADIPATGMRERPLQVQVQPTVLAEADSNVPLVDQPRRAEAAPLPVNSSGEISKLFKARPTVTQPVQVLNTQPHPQQPVLTPPPTPAVSVDTGFTAAMQQANDLISTPVRNAAWGEQIGERVLLMAGNQQKTADIRLTPAELGPLRVQVSVDDGATNVTFQAQHAVTREAIEQALPRLRELLAENGLSLGQASVGEQGVAEGDRDEQTASLQSGADRDGTPDAEGDTTGPRTLVSTDSLVDTFV